MKEKVKNSEASVCDRLKNIAKESRRPFAEVLQYYGIERFLYRLSQSSSKDTFILKGALMFTVPKAIEKFLIKPLTSFAKKEKFNSEWKAPGPWKKVGK